MLFNGKLTFLFFCQFSIIFNGSFCIFQQFFILFNGNPIFFHYLPISHVFNGNSTFCHFLVNFSWGLHIFSFFCQFSMLFNINLHFFIISSIFHVIQCKLLRFSFFVNFPCYSMVQWCSQTKLGRSPSLQGTENKWRGLQYCCGRASKPHPQPPSSPLTNAHILK